MSKETYTFTGTVVHVGEIQTFGSGFTKCDLVLNDGADKYPQEVCFECVKARADEAQKFQKGERIELSFDLRGREYQGRWFVNLNAWRLQRLDASDEPPQSDMPLDEEDDPSEPPF